MSMKILYITHEMDPYASLSEISRIARALPESMQDAGMEVRVFMPRYGKINERKHRLHEVIRLSGINITVADEDNPMIIKVASLPIAKIQIYFLDNEDFFHRKAYLRDDSGDFFPDNDHRSIFFNKGVIEIATKLGWEPDIIHVMGWMGSLVPFLARTQYKNEPVFKNAKIVYSTYGRHFDGPLGENFAQDAHLLSDLDKELNGKAPDCIDLYKIGAHYADAVIHSPTSESDALSAYISSLDKPVLESTYTEETEADYIESTHKFYKEISE